MPATIKPRRGTSTPQSGQLAASEIGVDTQNRRIFIGNGPGQLSTLVAGAATGASAGLLQFRGINAGEFLSSGLYGVTLSGSTPTSVFIGSGGTILPFRFATSSGSTTHLGLKAPTSVNTTAIGNPATVDYALPNTVPFPIQPDATKSTSRWVLSCSEWNSGTNTFQLAWVNPCTLCGTTGVQPSGTTGVGTGGFYGQLLIAVEPNSDDVGDIIVAAAPNNSLRYDQITNTIITPKVEATDTIESTGLILKTGNTGKVKFVAQSFAGSEVTVTVPSSASGGTLISTNSKISDLTEDSWSNFATKLSSGKEGSGNVVLKTNATLITPIIDTSLRLSGANPQIKAVSTTAICDIFSDNFVDSVNLGLTATTVTIGQKNGSTRLASDTISCATNIFSIGGLSAPTTDGNKDKGIQFRWHDGTSAKTGFFGYDDSSGKMIFIPDATISSDVVTSGTIGEINAKVEWANLLSVPSFATSSNNLGYFASTTSAQLAGVISDETGSGALVFGTSPSFITGINAASTTMALFNTTATTINFGGAATTINIGEASGIVNFSNDVSVNNHFSAKSKSFVIDHPTKQGKKLRYACLEGPENGVYVRGKLDGENTIVLPEYWVNLVDKESITVNLTGIGNAGYHTVQSIEDNKVIVQNSIGNVNCYYVVYGERKDISKLVTEFE